MIVQNLLVSEAVAASTTHNGDAFLFHMPKSNRGAVQYKMDSYSGTGTITIKLQGRMSDLMAWEDIDNSEKNFTSDTTTSVEDIQLFPEIRTVVTTPAGASGTITVQCGG